ncbi:MAG: transporter substrate-binding domain-containing protein [Bacteroidetes bacterium]|nr:transporter substrate-binding domain-containing protein [Bacteroidota bacterium]
MALRIFIFCLICSLFDCTKKAPFAQDPVLTRDLDSIRHRGFITALLDNNSVSYFIYKGRPMGYEYELLQNLAKDLKVDIKIKVISGVEEAIDKLNRGEGDLIAFPLTLTQNRTGFVSFTNSFFNTHQVLVQRRPAGWHKLTADQLEQSLLRDPTQLIGKDVYVIKGSSFQERMEHLSHEIGGKIILHEDSAETESLIREVAQGEIEYTVTDQMFAQVNQFYYPDIDIATVLSLPQQIAWAVRKNSPELGASINRWIARIKKNGTLKIIHEKYFESPRFSLEVAFSNYSSTRTEKLSPYDDALKQEAKKLGWDWRLLASVVYQESNFKPYVKSWVGAIGLMQVLPETGELFGVRNLWNPNQNIQVGVRFLKFLDDYWKKTVANENERTKFVLASYNVGVNHVIDAQRLTKKYGKKTDVWEDNVEYYLVQKSNPKYYRDALASAGYCRCDGPAWYVKKVLQRYEEYKIHIGS